MTGSPSLPGFILPAWGDDFYVRGVVPAVAALAAAGVLLPFLASFDPALAVIDAAGLAAEGVLLPLALKAGARRPGAKRVAGLAELRSSIVEQAQGMAELVALGAVHERATEADALICGNRSTGSEALIPPGARRCGPDRGELPRGVGGDTAPYPADRRWRDARTADGHPARTPPPRRQGERRPQPCAC